MEEENKSSNWINIVPSDILEEIFIRLPLKSILVYKTVSKQWRSILESNNFIEKRMNRQQSRKLLAAYNCGCGGPPRIIPESQFTKNEEIVYLHCNTKIPSLTCDGLVCIPEQGWINVLNPWTRQLRRFGYYGESSLFPVNRTMGFGRDKVTGSYKVVKMCTSPRSPWMNECSVLDVSTGEWSMLSPPPYKVSAGNRKSVCVNGSIYWLHDDGEGYRILSLDLHKEEFHKLSVPTTSVPRETEIVNLEDRLAIASTYTKPKWELRIWSMDAKHKTWSKTYSIGLANRVCTHERYNRWFIPVAVCKEGNLVFCDNHKRLFKYYNGIGKDEIRFLSSNTFVISPFKENVAPLPLRSTVPYPHPRWTSKCRLHPKRDEFGIIDVILTTLVVVANVWLRL